MTNEFQKSIKKFIPTNFKIPEVLETDRFRLRMLTVNDVKLDYDAVMTSIEHLHKTRPFGPRRKYPPEDLTLEENRMAIELYEKKFLNRETFTFTAMNLDETKCLGCLYIYPSHNPNYDVLIMMWVRQSEFDNGLDEILFSSVKKWIRDKWPFKEVAYSGRDVSWDEFE